MSSKRKKKKHTLFVIFYWPAQFGRPGTRYIAKDGGQTDLRLNAAKFWTQTEAKEFAKQKNIELTEITYIGQEDFTDFEIQHDT